MPIMKAELFGIELQANTDRKQAERLLNDDYSSLGFSERLAAKKKDADALVAKGESWAAVYGIAGYQQTSENNQRLTKDELYNINALKTSCDYFNHQTEGRAKLELLQKAEKEFYPERDKITATLEKDSASFTEVSNQAGKVTPMGQMNRVVDALPKLKKEADKVYLTEQAASATWKHSHKSKVLDVKHTIHNLDNAANQLENTNLLIPKK